MAARGSALADPTAFGLTPESVIVAALKATNRRLTEPNKACNVVCQDGSCRDQQASCPPIWACPSLNVLQKSYRCDTGICSSDKASCDKLKELGEGPHSCLQNETRCEDGTCRPTRGNSPTCLEFYGCPMSSPYRCSDGTCGNSSEDCAKDNICSSRNEGDAPFQCRNGDCVSDVASCNQ